MGFQTCPATGRLAHQFDRETHRCKCGRWQRGFKPKAENVDTRARGECQICERVMAMGAAGKLGHHGYTRPGYGSIQGDCPGVSHLPFPATDALESYQVSLKATLESSKAYTARLEAGQVESLPYSKYRGMGRSEILTVKPGDRYWTDALQSAKSQEVMLVRQVERELPRVAARLAKATELNAVSRV